MSTETKETRFVDDDSFCLFMSGMQLLTIKTLLEVKILTYNNMAGLGWVDRMIVMHKLNICGYLVIMKIDRYTNADCTESYCRNISKTQEKTMFFF